ncbi:sulfotransferase family protein [Halochromatium roseum]|uniref:sulfotransferase family protein n=1 Tax=Halochromatium roseum TaxID=391920 RepID=UPI00191389CA|nr:sulfotransferase family protein [Halochromatium roseum]
MSKIFGIGWAKTGTTTLGKCFQILGFDHQSQNLELVKDVGKGDLSRIIALAENKDTFEDWPWIIVYKQLDEAFPGSQFVLTKRKSEKWIRSYKNMLNKQSDASEEVNEIRRTLYGLPFPNVSESQLIERYEKHNSEVERYFHNRPGDLLVVDWEEGSGWNELCNFLGKDIPSDPFPHANKGAYSKGLTLSKIYDGFKKWVR